MNDISMSGLDRNTKERLMFFIDLMMFFIVAISMFFLVLNAYNAGKFFGSGSMGYAQQSLFYMAGSLVFVTVSMMWIFVRFFTARKGLHR
ncbi:MAG: hypothetical protein J7L32_04655 [Thermoplasmata archaeon]|nr:MAG: hypothetical protein FE035_00535 [Thermoplasmata archaeon]MCD6468582.1 hypothetical protein [Thermoplasmata archaeon]RLF26673.1 MAG: hypothetical protein DRN01_04235 [Thermoplasmata archaeon]